MRKFVTFLVFIMVFNLVGPYFVEAQEITTDSSQLDNEKTSDEDMNSVPYNPNSSVNQSDIESSEGKEGGEIENIEGDISTDDTSIPNQSDRTDIENTNEPTDNGTEQVEEPNIVNKENASTTLEDNQVIEIEEGEDEDVYNQEL